MSRRRRRRIEVTYKNAYGVKYFYAGGMAVPLVRAINITGAVPWSEAVSKVQ